YQYANLNLANIATDENDLVAARRHYKAVLASANRDSDIYEEAQEFMQATKRSNSSKKADRNSRTMVREGL
ncbi:MAG TPA: hypothetical protein VK364_00585, partial [Hymenobacter sp.]|nr:hypothetical protein [Hymenobacter sp.]